MSGVAADVAILATAEVAAIAPSAQAVTICRKTVFVQSPAANIPLADVCLFLSTTI